jgi:hypothetical protein
MDDKLNTLGSKCPTLTLMYSSGHTQGLCLTLYLTFTPTINNILAPLGLKNYLMGLCNELMSGDYPPSLFAGSSL